MQRRLKTTLIPVLILALSSVTIIGCAQRIDPVTGISTKATPYEQALAINATIAITVEEFNRGIIETQRAGFISINITDVITQKTFSIAVRNRKLTEILALGPDEAKKQSGEILRLSALIQQDARALVLRKDVTAENEEKLLRLTSSLNSVFSLILNFSGQLKAAGIL